MDCGGAAQSNIAIARDTDIAVNISGADKVIDGIGFDNSTTERECTPAEKIPRLRERR